MKNNVPINGYVYQYEGEKKAHIHKIEITNPNDRNVRFSSGYTSVYLRHNHFYTGETEPGLNESDHTHRYFMFTSFENGHKHILTGLTGPAIKQSDGEHYHSIRGITKEAGEVVHVHAYVGRTLT